MQLTSFRTFLESDCVKLARREILAQERTIRGRSVPATQLAYGPWTACGSKRSHGVKGYDESGRFLGVAGWIYHHRRVSDRDPVEAYYVAWLSEQSTCEGACLADAEKRLLLWHNGQEFGSIVEHRVVHPKQLGFGKWLDRFAEALTAGRRWEVFWGSELFGTVECGNHVSNWDTLILNGHTRRLPIPMHRSWLVPRKPLPELSDELLPLYLQVCLAFNVHYFAWDS